MIVHKLEFKNLKSYGEQVQVIRFDEKGKLILLSGKNGSGKSTIKDAIDLALYNKVAGKRKKNLPLTKIKNRTNYQGIPYSGIEFINNQNKLVNIKRAIPNTNTKLFVDNINKSEEFRKYTEEQKDSLIGFNYDTFKSFISLSMNDFKNFITLKPSEKNDLVNKLFNLEMLDSLYTIANDEYKQIMNTIEYNYTHYNENERLKETTESLFNSLKNKENISIDDLSKEIKGIQPEYIKLTELIDEYDKQMVELSNNIIKYNNRKRKQETIYNKKLVKIENLQEKLDLYDEGYCPYCDSELKGDSHIKKKKELKEDKELIESKIGDFNDYLETLSIELAKLSNKKNDIYNKLTDSKYKLEDLKKEVKKLRFKRKKLKEDKNEIIDVNEISEKFEELKKNSYIYSNKLKDLKKQKKNYEALKGILDENNIRKRITKQAVKPINKYIKKYSEKLGLNFTIKLGDDFNAFINNDIVDPETLSTGEDKIINIIIALSYLCTILDKQHSNILFIDELFNSIDKENINLILKLLKEISKDYNLNIIIVHHYLDETDQVLFDKIIQTQKAKFGFSEIKIIKE
jgi:DNA repair protein SbcC/Rad50